MKPKKPVKKKKRKPRKYFWIEDVYEGVWDPTI
jgi:hypothetical protein